MRKSYNYKRGRSKSWQQFGPAFPLVDEAILWDARVPDTYAMVITRVTTSPFEMPGEATPQSDRSHVGALAPHHITPKFLHALALLAECLSATDGDLISETEGESSSSESSIDGCDEVCPSLRFPRHESKPCTMSYLQGPGPYDQVISKVTSNF